MMFRWCIALLILLLPRFSRAQTALYPEDGTIYDGKLHVVELTMHPDSLTALFKPENRWSNHSYPALFVYDGKDSLLKTGIRIRGNTSRNAKKQSLRLDFDEFIDQNYQGLKTFNLNGSHNDPSLIREYLSTLVMNRAGNPGMRSNLVKLYINKQFYGVYCNAEYFGKRFVESRYEGDAGNLYKCSWPADLVYIDNNQQSYKKIINTSPLNERAYELKTNELADDYSGLVKLIKVINNTPSSRFKAAIDSVFEVQQYLKTLATEVLIGHWDNYFYNKNNYYLYQQPENGKFVYMPYDMDNTFGVEWGVSDINKRNIYAWGNLSGSKAPLTYKLLAVPEFKMDYERYLRQLVKDVFNDTKLFPVLDSLKTMLNDAVKSDPYYSGTWTSDYGYDYTDWLNSFTKAIDSHSPFGLKPYISDRVNSARTQFIYPQLSVAAKSDIRISVYPNPFKDLIAIEGLLESGIAALYNSEGKLMQQKILEVGNNYWTGIDLPNGVYFIRISTQTSVTQFRLVKTD